MKTLTLDIETTGKVPKGANYATDFDLFPRVVSIAYKINDEITKHIVLNQSGMKIPWEATAIHGITNEMCEQSRKNIIDALVEMLVELDEDKQATDIIIGHNLYFDLSIIKAELIRRNDQILYLKFSDLVQKEKRRDTMWKTIKFCGKMPKLTELYFKLFGTTFSAHNAKEDVDATYKCFVELVRLGVIQC